jgi:hypothetical protein
MGVRMLPDKIRPLVLHDHLHRATERPFVSVKLLKESASTSEPFGD